ncbi:MAG: hypothetical protein HDR02_16315 [Lachnospiraceae bacterium]|nr:hypothetical protein [Lachnospiraceae bacterium]
MRKISKEDLFREIGEIDEVYIEEAERVKRRRRTAPWVQAMTVAASLLVCVGVGYGALRLTGSSNDTANQSNAGGMENAEEMCAMAEDSEGAMDIQTPMEAQNDAAPEEKNMQDSGLPETFSEEGADGDRNYTETESESQSQESDGMVVLAEKEDTIEDTNAALGTQELAVAEPCNQMSDSKQLTWEAAQEDAVYGKYVSVQVPEGYVYESGVRSQSALYVVWCRDMEEIDIRCRQADESVSDWLVDVEEPQEYDLGLYTIPWADSVPQKLMQKVSNATFHRDQLTPEIVAARSYQVEDQGDVSGWRTNIRILYGDNVLVEISSKGPSPEEIYALINLEN